MGEPRRLGLRRAPVLVGNVALDFVCRVVYHGRMSHPISLRVKPDNLAEIDSRARAHGLSRNEYMVRCALGELTGSSSTAERLDEHEERLARLEEIAYRSS